ncbi:O-fucosyltransferase family protein [Forsythia ovata]|uniref:O-fucosyltransferase family protein n=1 Tax=Forsythia ovata TaxID=205694 RepID=A0ABD1WZQ0_9LAMI
MAADIAHKIQLELPPVNFYAIASLDGNTKTDRKDRRYGVFKKLSDGGLAVGGFKATQLFCDGVGIARLLNATLVLPKFEVAAYWNESSGFGDVFDMDYFIQQINGFVNVVKVLPPEIASKEPIRVDCGKRKDIHCMQKLHCQACYNALRLTNVLEKKGIELLEAIPKPFVSLHLRFEPDMVAYSQCEFLGLSSASVQAIENKPIFGETTGRVPSPQKKLHLSFKLLLSLRTQIFIWQPGMALWNLKD